MDKLIEQLRQQGTKGFAEIAQPLFDKHSKLQGFRWKQYTDYFNDGEECNFSVHSDYIELLIDGRWQDDLPTAEACGSYDGGQWVRGPNPHPEAVAVGKLLKTLGTDALKALFGDHAQIEATRRNGVQVESYEDHD